MSGIMNRWELTSRRARIIQLILVSGLLLPLGVAATWAAFADEATVTLGSEGSIGGDYDIAIVDADGHIQQGNPAPHVLDTTGASTIEIVGTGSATIETSVVTTTEVTGPVVLSLYNAFPGGRPADPGSATAADPFDVALYTISIDGVVLSERQTATAINAAGMTISDWIPHSHRSVMITIEMPTGLGNPYYYNRTLILGMHFDGMSS